MAVKSALINVMTMAVQKAARGLVRDFGEVEQLQVSMKGPADFVSQADQKAEKLLRAELGRVRNNFGFLMEEGTNEPGDGVHRWIVDPLDGTTNFLHAIPHFAISVALEKEGEIVAGVVYDPIKDEMFWAEKGAGAFLNDRRLRVSARRDLDKAVIATGIPHLGRSDHKQYLPYLTRTMAACAGVRRFGAASLDLAYVAAGRYEGFFEFDLAPWDLAAGLLLVTEAGGFVADMDGGRDMLRQGSVMATNANLHQPLANLLRGGA